MFAGLDEAAQGLLLSTCNALNNSGVQYVIAGGWVPILRGGVLDIQHPGTRDVDILFNDEIGSVRNAVQTLLEAGFLPSAKHEFQLLYTIKVGNMDFIYNVDLMHPGEQDEAPGMFSDIFDFGVSDPSDPSGKHWAKSIIFPAASIIFGDYALDNTRLNSPNIAQFLSISLALQIHFGP